MSVVLFSVDTSNLKHQINQNLDDRPLSSLAEDSPYTLSPCIEEILLSLQSIEESNLFQKFWDENGALAIESLERKQKLSVEDVVQKIWNPSWDKLLEVKESLTNLKITLGEINEYFGNCNDEADIVKELRVLKHKIHYYEASPWIQKCLKKIRIHRNLEGYRSGASAVIKAAEALDWKGDLAVLQSIVDTVS